jgi:hypothetical protein
LNGQDIRVGAQTKAQHADPFQVIQNQPAAALGDVEIRGQRRSLELLAVVAR